jgi:DNA-directed RNA polymerase I, II, and III subunit RPABC1
MVLTEEEITRLYRVRKTLMQMLKDRDYVIVDHDLNMTLSQFKNKHGENMKREDLTINRRKRGDDSDQVLAAI